MSITVDRSIRFSAWEDNSGSEFDRFEAAATIKSLAEHDRVLAHATFLSAVEVLQVGNETDPTCFQLLALRDFENRPLGWGPGVLPEPLKIDEHMYTADLTHVAIWGDKIACHDLYNDAPGLGRLSSYLRDNAGQRVVFRSLYRPDLADRLQDISGFRRFTFGVSSPEKKEALIKHGGMISSFFGANVASKAPSLQVSLGMSKASPRSEVLEDDLADEILELAQHAEDFFDSLRIAGKSKSQETKTGKPKTVEINLLKERLQVARSISRAAEGGNLPDRDAVYQAFIEARAALDKDQTLERAAMAELTIPGVDDT